MTLLQRLKYKWRSWFSRKSPFALTETISVKITPLEREAYETDAYRNGRTLQEWARENLNESVTDGTKEHLLKGGISFRPKYEKQVRLLPQVKEKKKTTMPKKKLTGHPCFHLDGVFPPNLGPSSCQGTCRHPMMNGKPCYWGALAAKQCDGFEPKVVKTSPAPTKNNDRK